MNKIWNQYSYAIFLIILSCCLAFILSLRFTSGSDEDFLMITVSEGDSLWGISDQFSSQHGLSNKEFIKWVKLHNNIEEDQIFPGEELIIPVNQQTWSSTELASALSE
jgi:LysM repeat protein